MPYCEFNNNKYFYYEQLPEKLDSVNKTILFVHGAGGNGSYWIKQLLGVGDKFRTLAPDLPGHGKSGGTACDNIAAYKEFIRKLVDKVIEGRFYLAGHSLGGAVTLDFSLSYPELLEGIILIATGAKFGVLPAILDIFKNGRHNHELVRTAYGKNTPQRMIELGSREMTAVSPAVWFKDFTACDRFDVTSRLAEIQLPALILTGTDDLLTPLKYGRLLKSGLTGARMEEIGGAGHMLMIERPDDINRRIVDFMSLK
ncbi:MAG: 2-hydroxy-6-oxo-6-phenylhexa-2,4-dienoate hydrolase [Pelotomaculum sp. PtaU1.Bin035]|nr:MAG: 2-hydroxy-6-oxo-6-phenylhexa-2,4-dienoate hydrolase [Pelotomaculum sp. PtaU1.Bin035]